VPYPNYGLPPRNVLQSGYVPSLQPSTHRTAAQQSQAQNMVSQPTPGFIQQRGQSSFPFGAGLGQVQTASQHQQSNAPHSSNSQQTSQLQQQQTNGSSNTLPPHLMQSGTTPSISGATTSVSSVGEVGLDPNDFPALGSAPLNVNTTTTTNGNSGSGATTSYASQAGTSVSLGGAASANTTIAGAGGIGGATGTSGVTNQPRDFTADDFPALGGQVHPPSQGQTQNPPPPNQSQESHPHPPGLNGFQHSEHSQQHRQALLGTLGSSVLQQATPGMLNLGPTQARNVHPGFQQGQTEAEKQQHRVSDVNDCKCIAFDFPYGACRHEGVYFICFGSMFLH
jgi:CCR4-NOT transcription complex subunit 2